MSLDQEPSLRSQLIEARGKIVTQLNELYLRGNGAAYKGWDAGGIIAELEGELREIDAILANRDSPDA